MDKLLYFILLCNMAATLTQTEAYFILTRWI